MGGEIARDVLQAVAIVGGDADVGVEAEPVDLRAAAAQDHRLPRRPRPDEAPDPRAARSARGYDARHRRTREACEKRLGGDRRIGGHVIETSEPPIDLAHERTFAGRRRHRRHHVGGLGAFRCDRRSPATSAALRTSAGDRRAADGSDGIVDLALGLGFLSVGQLADLMADLFSEDAEAKPWGQHSFQDARLALHRKRNEPSSQLGNLGIIGIGWQAHGSSVTRSGPIAHRLRGSTDQTCWHQVGTTIRLERNRDGPNGFETCQPRVSQLSSVTGEMT
jgi:hypothetical protein